MELTQIFIAHPFEFAAKSLKHFAQEAGIEAYLLDNLADFSYLIKDLAPQVILIHADLLSKHKESFNEQMAAHPRVHIVVLAKSADNEWNQKYPLQIIEPFAPEHIKDILVQMLESGRKTH